MYETLTGNNKYLLQLDPERREAHRREIRRALAEIAVKKSNISDLTNIVQKLNADSDQAADEHSAAASTLQAELDLLDAEQIENVMASHTTPPKSLLRRRLILDELTELNKTLEMRTEANRRASMPVERQIRELSKDITSETVLENQLVSLCSPATRQKMMIAELKLQVANVGLKEAQRLASITAHNKKICTLNRDQSGAAIQSTKLADAESLVGAMEAEIGTLHAESATLQSQALNE